MHRWKLASGFQNQSPLVTLSVAILLKSCVVLNYVTDLTEMNFINLTWPETWFVTVEDLVFFLSALRTCITFLAVFYGGCRLVFRLIAASSPPVADQVSGTFIAFGYLLKTFHFWLWTNLSASRSVFQLKRSANLIKTSRWIIIASGFDWGKTKHKSSFSSLELFPETRTLTPSHLRW